MQTATSQPTGRTAALSLIALESLPCGCVSAVYRARPTIVELELVEAKGPHCLYMTHQAGRVVRLGVPEESLEDGDEALA